jgi:hypothetical protein
LQVGSIGHVLALTEIWNGTSWTEVNDLNTARDELGGCGTTTAALAIGGVNPTVSATLNLGMAQVGQK